MRRWRAESHLPQCEIKNKMIRSMFVLVFASGGHCFCLSSAPRKKVLFFRSWQHCLSEDTQRKWYWRQQQWSQGEYVSLSQHGCLRDCHHFEDESVKAWNGNSFLGVSRFLYAQTAQNIAAVKRTLHCREARLNRATYIVTDSAATA